MRRVTALLAVLILATAAGCAKSRDAEGRASGCGSCHGFPPGGTHPQPVGEAWTSVDCRGCHPTTIDPLGNIIPADAGGTHANGVVDGGAPPGHDAAFLDPRGLIDPANAKIHGAAANQGPGVCAACHGATFDGVLGASGLSCNGCHASIGGANFADWKTNCSFCHGTRTVGWTAANPGLSAPPEDVSGGSDTTLVTVGAHQTHVAAAVACTTCHPSPLPTNLLSAGHIDQAGATVTFPGVAVADGASQTWSANAATCGTVYCHGSTLTNGGGTLTAPLWTSVGTGQGDCGTCHARPPPAPHPQPTEGLVTFTDAVCSLCHLTGIGTDGVRTAGHLDGVISPRVAGQAVPTCTSCHAGAPPEPFHTRTALYTTPVAPLVCTDCHVGFDAVTHADAPVAATLTCSTCHGNAAASPAPTPATPRQAAPPVDRFGDPAGAAVGAHAAHLDNGTYSNPIACAACHKDVAAYGLKHANGAPDVDFSAGPGQTGTFTPGAAGAPGTCTSTWCHGNFPGGTNAAPLWSDTISCSSCHTPLVPVTGKHFGHVVAAQFNLNGYTCQTCHPGATTTRTGGVVTSVAPGKPNHVNGTKNVSGGAITLWNATAKTCTALCHSAPDTPYDWNAP